MTFPTIDSAILFLETQLETLDAKRARLVAAIDGLRMVNAVDGDDDSAKPEPWLKANSNLSVSRPQQPASPVTTESGRDKADDVQQAIAKGARTPAAIRKMTGFSAYRVNARLKHLVTARAIRKTGTGPRNIEYHPL